ncbi:MAG: DUF2924 domain-containing protein [Planctomycetota bacterium]
MPPQKTITAEIAELRAMTVAELVVRYEALHGKLPRVKHRNWLWRRCAWKLQEQRYGGLSTVAKRRLDELIAELDLPLVGETVKAKVSGRGKPDDPIIGTVLTRTWRGTEVRATRTEQGWECRGVVYRSLSAVAKAITGSHCSGKAWFGLTKRKEAAK